MEVCHDYEREPASHHSATAVTEFLLIFGWVPFAVHFGRKLWSLPDRNALVWSVLAYLVCTTVFIVSKFWLSILEPIVQTHIGFSPPLCRFYESVIKLTSFLAYIILIQAYTSRCQISFEGTPLEVQPWLIRLCTALNIANGLFLFITLAVRSADIHCYDMVYTGLLHSMGLSKRVTRECKVPMLSVVFFSRSVLNLFFCISMDDCGGLTIAGYQVFSVLFFTESAVLGCLFVKRMRRLLKESDYDDPQSANENRQFRMLISKSTVTGFCSLATFVISLTVNAFLHFPAVVSLDLASNGVFVYCLFHFGSDLYQMLFGWMNECCSNERRNTMNSNKPFPNTPRLVLSFSQTASNNPRSATQ